MSTSIPSAGLPGAVDRCSDPATGSHTAGTPAAVTLPHSLMLAGALPVRDGSITISRLCDLYMAQYTGRDRTVPQRLDFWRSQIGSIPLEQLTDDEVHLGIEALTQRTSRYYAGKDADGRPIFRAKRKPLAGSTINRYISALASVLTWAIRKRIAPKGFDHPVRRIELNREGSGKTRFLSDDERRRLLEACKASTWPRLYLLVLMALTTGARKSELLGLHWRDVDLERALAFVDVSKNGDPKGLPLLPAVIEQLHQFKGAPTTLVFPSHRDSKKPISFEKPWHDALKAAGVKAFRFHDLRHSCASFLAQNGASLLEIADLLGHRQISMTKRYSHFAAGDRSALVERVMGDIR
ncbi:site-specific integrase [Rubrivivax sp. JA1026]|uniref:tyrosine-type recombinase/integrase n=1 Tax=Rubrivivax sp. JA1026 TaxID=2710888 RepID=UPI0013E98266|nr:site-specific integrase [Rubrivivax sp. JA1026]